MEEKQYLITTAQKKYDCKSLKEMVEKTTALNLLGIDYSVTYFNIAGKLTQLLVKPNEVLSCKII